MAEIIENEKGFKVIKMSRTEVNQVFGGFGICDYCSTIESEGYYIAVLNHWYCEKDYKRFLENAINYPEDQRIEKINFVNTKQLLNLK